MRDFREIVREFIVLREQGRPEMWRCDDLIDSLIDHYRYGFNARFQVYCAVVDTWD
jgi:hypothetical protein